jgi:hypothetical protein
VNGDGRPDIICANRISGTVSVFPGTGGGNFGARVDSEIGVTGAWTMTLGDTNGDQVDDIGIASDTSGSLSVLFGNGTTSFTKAEGIPVPGGSPQAIAIRDLNRDGKSELVWLDNRAGTIRFMANG